MVRGHFGSSFCEMKVVDSPVYTFCVYGEELIVTNKIFWTKGTHQTPLGAKASFRNILAYTLDQSTTDMKLQFPWNELCETKKRVSADPPNVMIKMQTEVVLVAQLRSTMML